MENNPHRQHRSRLRRRYIKEGADSFETHQLIEMLLFHSIAQSDTNPAAHNLLDIGRKINGGLACADIRELCSASGIGDKSALLIKTSIDTALRLLCDRLAGYPMDSEVTLGLYFYLRMAAKGDRCTSLLLLDRKDIIIDCINIAHGTLWRCDDISVEIRKRVNDSGAAAFAVCHNHLNGSDVPSVEDCFLTGKLEELASDMEVGFAGSFIVTDHSYVKISLRGDEKQ